MTSSQHSLEYLDLLPDHLYSAVVTHTHGSIKQRCLGVLQWRKALLDGVLPEQSELDWPLVVERALLCSKLSHSGLVSHCKHQVKLTDQLILDILAWLDGEQREFFFEEAPGASEPGGNKPKENETRENKPKENETRENKPEENETKENKPGQNTSNANTETEDATGTSLTAPASSDSSTQSSSPSIDQDSSRKELLTTEPTPVNDEAAPDCFNWESQADQLDQLQNLMQGYAVERQLGWDLSRGLLARTEWKAILALHKQIKRSSYLKNIIALIGRGQTQKAEQSEHLEHCLPTTNTDLLSSQLNLSPQAPVEASGVTRSDDVGRMLPSELSMLGHTRLKYLWHAKRAERMLLAYQYEGVMSEHLPSFDTESLVEQARGKRQLETRGPMFLALDTSASMKGKPEQLAKAIVLEAMRVAVKEQRPCHLIAFSGPQQIQQYTLANTEQGWGQVLDIIALSFHGGTDLSQVIDRCLGLVDEKKWQTADMLLISDSRFQLQDELIERLVQAKAVQGLRLHGINVSRWNSAAMEKICQPVYRIAQL